MKCVHHPLSFFSRESRFHALFCGVTSTVPGEITYDGFQQQEKEILDGFAYSVRKESYLLGRIAAKGAVSQLSGVPEHLFRVETGIFMHPVVVGKDLVDQQVSLAHCQGVAVAIAFPGHFPMGIDIEDLGGSCQDAIWRSLTGREKIICQRQDDQYFSWAAKEAVSKATRTGLTIPMHLLEVKSIEKEGQFSIIEYTHFSQYRAVGIKIGNRVLVIAYPRLATFENIDSFGECLLKTPF